MEPSPATSTTVCVTGAGGFLASWVLKLLLSKDHYVVHGTVRDLRDGKNAHLKALENAGKRLRLFKADVLDYDSVTSAIAGCDGVFHIASPVTPVPSGLATNPEEDVIATAVIGTLNVLKASYEAKVKRVVVVSSVAAVFNNPNWPKGKPFNEDSWSDEDCCRKKGSAKLLCMRQKLGWTFIGDWSIDAAYGEGETVGNRLEILLDVRDVANALLLAYETPEASGRYICSSTPRKLCDIINISKSLYPNFTYPQKFLEVEEEDSTTFSSEKLQKLGWTFRHMEETIRDSFESYTALGILT
uniref:NAD-dependent epimerase/dehydratase domain-containing protein n=1 Tax=Leersia perrieri TaxID=77586 RepID=A0A0D9X532_9ORYZ